MNRFKKSEFPAIEIEPEFIGVEELGECYRFTGRQFEVYCPLFTVYCDLELYHFPQAKTSKMNRFIVNNIKVHTDDTELRIKAEEHETIIEKIESAIKIIGLM